MAQKCSTEHCVCIHHRLLLSMLKNCCVSVKRSSALCNPPKKGDSRGINKVAVPKPKVDVRHCSSRTGPRRCHSVSEQMTRLFLLCPESLSLSGNPGVAVTGSKLEETGSFERWKLEQPEQQTLAGRCWGEQIPDHRGGNTDTIQIQISVKTFLHINTTGKFRCTHITDA